MSVYPAGDAMTHEVSRFRAAEPLGHLSGLTVGGAAVFERCRDELARSRLLDRIDRAKREFERSISGTTCRGYPYVFGGMPPEVAVRLYALVRELRPSILVETGVCNGVSTAVILAALGRNGAGKLHSIDLPEFTGTAYPEGAFWEKKKGAAVPKDKEPGWVIPDELRDRWELTIGRSQDDLPALLHCLGSIDFFLHDSEHSHECMSFEYRAAWQHLRTGGVLASDDVSWNSAFEDFSRQHSRKIHQLSQNLAFLIK